MYYTTVTYEPYILYIHRDTYIHIYKYIYNIAISISTCNRPE